MVEKKVPSFGANHAAPEAGKHRNDAGIQLRSKVWLEVDGKLLMGWGRAQLLERIDELGSISAAARSMKVAYRNAWLWVEAMNSLAPRPLVEKSTGGPRGGYARLTEEGRRVLREYKETRERVRRMAGGAI